VEYTEDSEDERDFLLLDVMSAGLKCAKMLLEMSRNRGIRCFYTVPGMKYHLRLPTGRR